MKVTGSLFSIIAPSTAENIVQLFQYKSGSMEVKS